MIAARSRAPKLSLDEPILGAIGASNSRPLGGSSSHVVNKKAKQHQQSDNHDDCGSESRLKAFLRGADTRNHRDCKEKSTEKTA
jgi:hypothetical protein